MRRARSRRRIALGATAAVLFTSGGAAALTVATSSSTPTMRTSSTIDVDDVATATSPTTSIQFVPEADEADTPVGDRFDDRSSPSSTSPAPVTSGIDEVPVVPGPPRAAVPEPPIPTLPAAPTTLAPPAPTTPAPAPAPPPAPTTTGVPVSSQTISSACGDVVVTIEGGTVRITSLRPAPGFEPQVATDGPGSIELKFIGTDGTCEVHGELEQGVLAVEVQNPEPDD